MDIKDLTLACVGINHLSSTFTEREIFQINRKDWAKSITFIKDIPGVDGVILLNTCNRMEFYLVLHNNINPMSVVRQFYLENKNIFIDSKESLFYEISGIETAKHLFRVISGLESLVLGEYQILGQVREAYSLACTQKTVEKIMHKLFHAAFRCGKTVRNNTCIGEGRRSVSGAAAGILIDNLKPENKICIIGVNENTRIIASELTKHGFFNLVFINRTLLKAELMASEYGGGSNGLDKIEDVMASAEAVFSCTGAPSRVIPSMMLARLEEQGKCPQLLIDMAVPRDINTEGISDNISVYDIGKLQEYLGKQREAGLADLPKAEKIIEDELAIFTAWTDYSSNEILAPYAEKLEMIRLQLMDDYKSEFSEDNYKIANKLTRQLLHRLQSTFVRILVKKE